MFARDPSTGALVQLDRRGGCVARRPAAGCATGVALAGVEGMAISNDGNDVYVAAALSNALDMFSRNSSTGALSQADQPGRLHRRRCAGGLHDGHAGGGADAVAVSPDDADVYVTSLLSNSITAFARTLDDRLADPAARHLGLCHLSARGRLLARTRAQRAGGARRVARRGQRVRRRVRVGCPRRPRPQRDPAR